MIQRLVTNRWPVSAVLSNTTVTKRQDRTLDLTAQQWILLEELAKLLEPLEIATVLFCTEKKVAISCVLPVMHSAMTSMGCEEGDSPSIVAFKTAVVDSIMKRWSLYGMKPNSPLVLAAALDPHFKSLKFLTDDLKKVVGPYSLLIGTSYFISCSVHARLLPYYLSIANGAGGVGIFELLVFQCFI